METKGLKGYRTTMQDRVQEYLRIHWRDGATPVSAAREVAAQVGDEEQDRIVTLLKENTETDRIEVVAVNQVNHIVGVVKAQVASSQAEKIKTRRENVIIKRNQNIKKYGLLTVAGIGLGVALSVAHEAASPGALIAMQTSEAIVTTGLASLSLNKDSKDKFKRVAKTAFWTGLFTLTAGTIHHFQENKVPYEDNSPIVVATAGSGVAHNTSSPPVSTPLPTHTSIPVLPPSTAAPPIVIGASNGGGGDGNPKEEQKRADCAAYYNDSESSFMELCMDSGTPSN